MKKITLKQEEMNLIRKFSELYFKLRNLSYKLYHEYNYRNDLDYVKDFNLKNNIPKNFQDIEKFIFAQIPNNDFYLKIGCYNGSNIHYPLEFITNSKGYELFCISIISERFKVYKDKEIVFKFALDENTHEIKRQSIAKYTLQRNSSIDDIDKLISEDFNDEYLNIILPIEENTRNKLVSLISNALDTQEKTVDEFVNFMKLKKEKELENLLK